MILSPSFPPLMRGRDTGADDPFVVACREAAKGIDAGLVTWSISADRLRAALVLAPEEPVERAMAGFIACGIGIQNALGALAPPEVAVHLGWNGGIYLNGACCGELHAAAATAEPDAIPDWLVITLTLRLRFGEEVEPGNTPGFTALRDEGCGDIDPLLLLEAWARHTLLWISDLEDPAARVKLHREWIGLAWKQGEEMTFDLDGALLKGQFVGVDENFGMLLKQAGKTRLIPLSSLIGEP